MDKIADRIKGLREEKGLSQAELADVMGVNRMTINNYENNKRAPDVDFAMNCADYFGVTVEYLTGRSEFRHKEDIEISLKQAEELFRTIERLPQSESQRMLSYLIASLDKAREMEMESEIFYILNNCFIQTKSMLSAYEKLQKSIVPPIIELKRRKVPEDMIMFSVKDKPSAIYDAAFHAVDIIADTMKDCAKTMADRLGKLAEEAWGK